MVHSLLTQQPEKPREFMSKHLLEHGDALDDSKADDEKEPESIKLLAKGALEGALVGSAEPESADDEKELAAIKLQAFRALEGALVGSTQPETEKEPTAATVMAVDDKDL